MKRLCLLTLAASSAWAQLQFSLSDGRVITNSYSVSASVGDKLDFAVHVTNLGTAPVTISRIGLSGQNFAIVRAPSFPYVVAASAFLDVTIEFAPASATLSGSYSANFATYNTSNGISASILFVGTASYGPTISISQNGQHQDIPNGAPIDFGRVQSKTTKTLSVAIENRSPNTITIKSMQLSSGAFSVLNGPSFPLTLNPTESATFDLGFSPPSAQNYSSAITIDNRVVPLVGQAFDPPFPPPSITVDSALVSGIQARVAITLASPAPSQATGMLTLAFQPATGLADDSAIHFLVPANRRVSFSFNAGDTVATIGTSKQALFQTGTTAGTLTFLVDFQSTVTQVNSSISPHTIAVDGTIANRPNDAQLTIQVTGYDNSKSTTTLGFTFYDTAGVTVPPGRITYDATKDFSQFFAKSTGGGMFSLLAQFPVKGSTAKIAAADVDLTNSVGTTTLTKLRFSPCTPVITTPCPDVNGCPCQ